LKRSLLALAETLGSRDQVAIVVYAGASGLVLAPTPGDRHAAIFAALDRLEAGGGTNGAEGIQLAYRVAADMARPGSINRVVLATDGDFNVGVTSRSDLHDLIESRQKSGIFLSVLGFGMGNYKDSTLEMLADRGNGNYAYIDSLSEARKVLVNEGGSTLFTLASDVKLQLELNPDHVAAYRLIGYENRRLAARDFNDDAKDAGELGAGHSVTALYELIPHGVPLNLPGVDALRYQSPTPRRAGSPHSSELLTIKLRYKRPGQQHSVLRSTVVRDESLALSETSEAFRFSAAVAAFGMSLRGSDARGNASFELSRSHARGALGVDSHRDRRELVGGVDRARRLSGGRSAPTQKRAV
jgi:Ca-activated chloride channel family protein